MDGTDLAVSDIDMIAIVNKQDILKLGRIIRIAEDAMALQNHNKLSAKSENGK